MRLTVGAKIGAVFPRVSMGAKLGAKRFREAPATDCQRPGTPSATAAALVWPLEAPSGCDCWSACAEAAFITSSGQAPAALTCSLAGLPCRPACGAGAVMVT